MAEVLALERLAAESRSLELPLTLVVDGRGLCRLLWVGDLEHSGRLIEQAARFLPPSGKGSEARDLCRRETTSPLPGPQRQEAIVALDLSPLIWLRYQPQSSAGGQWPAALFLPKDRPWGPLGPA